MAILETYHISNKDFISIKDLVKKISVIMNVDFNNLVENNAERKGKDQAYRLNSSKLKKQLKWKNKINLDAGLKKTINWININSKKLKNLAGNIIIKNEK